MSNINPSNLHNNKFNNNHPFSKLGQYTAQETDLKILLRNINGLRTKIIQSDLRDFFSNHDLICICETWLTDQIDMQDYTLPGYEFVKYNRVRRSIYGRPSGGILVYYKKNLSKDLKIKNGFSEIIEFDVQDTHFVFAYVSPSNSTFQLRNVDTLEKLENLINRLIKTRTSS